MSRHCSKEPHCKRVLTGSVKKDREKKPARTMQTKTDPRS